VKIYMTRVTEVPDGPVCVNWAYRTFMPAEQNFRCEHFRRDSQQVNDLDMGGSSDRTSNYYSSRCALFDAELRDENGVGPHKCADCLSAPTQPKEAGRDGRG